MTNTNIINAVFGSGICAVTTSAYRANYGMVLRFSGIDLPTAFECDFSNYDTSTKDSITAIGQNGEVQIPDDLWDSGLNIYAYVYLHPTDDSGVTVYTVTIPVLGRPNRTEEQPTPHEQSVIEQAISALNDAVEQTAADVVAADASASAAAQSEANASVSERSAAASASAALASQNAAESAAQSATEQALASAESARNAANSASQAAQSATAAQESAEQAEQAVQSITDDVERAERAANTATGKATEAASSAVAASTKAAQAEQSATAAAQSASSASTAAQNAASSATAAESSATDAETAKQDAQAAQAAAEQAAQSVSGLSAQIEQNTADIAELVQSKAGALIDTATGSIASFMPDATVPTVKGLTVNVEPVQDLHGYDNPWPAGGGKNLLDSQIETSGYIRWTDGAFISGVDAWKCSTDYSPILPNTNYILYKYETATSSVAGYAIYDENKNYIDGKAYSSGATISITTPQNARYIRASWGRNASTPVALMLSTETDTSFSPYSNICPISGWDAVEVQRTGVNVFGGLKFARAMEAVAYAPQFSLDTVEKTFSFTRSGGTDVGYVTPIFSPKSPMRMTAILTYKNNGNNNSIIFRYTDGSYLQLAMPNSNGSKATVIVVSATGKLVKNVVLSYFTPSPTTVYYDESGFYDGVVTAADFVPYLGQTYPIQLGQTVYGGTLDVTGGKMVVDRAEIDMGTMTWDKASGGYYSTSINGVVKKGSQSKGYDNAISSQYKSVSIISIAGLPDFGLSVDSGGNVQLKDSRYATAAELKSGLDGVQLCYELATPVTISLTPLEISVLTKQTNNIWADSGDVSVEYAADLKTYINNKIAAAVAALS